jgi:pimeloyl-ACP methyl ester carboxylesterase
MLELSFNRRCAADCKTAYFKASNHWLYLEEPQKFNALLLRFVLDEELADKEYL